MQEANWWMVETGRVTKAGKPIRKRTVVKLWGVRRLVERLPAMLDKGEDKSILKFLEILARLLTRRSRAPQARAE